MLFKTFALASVLGLAMAAPSPVRNPGGAILPGDGAPIFPEPPILPRDTEDDIDTIIADAKAKAAAAQKAAEAAVKQAEYIISHNNGSAVADELVAQAEKTAEEAKTNAETIAAEVVKEIQDAIKDAENGS